MNQRFTKPRDIFNQINVIFMTIVLVTDGLMEKHLMMLMQSGRIQNEL